MKNLEDILALIKNQQTPEEIEVCGLVVKAFLTQANDEERQIVKEAIKNHIAGFLVESQQLIQKWQ